MAGLIPADAAVRLANGEDVAVVCSECGRSKDRPAGDACEQPDWHQPQPDVPDVDVTAEDGDDLAPLTEEELADLIGPRPGATWSELYARTHLSLTYANAEKRGLEQRVNDLERGLALILWAAGGSVTVTRQQAVEAPAMRQVYRASDPATGAVTWTALP